MAIAPKELTEPTETRTDLAEKSLKRNLSHLLISTITDVGPEIEFGATTLHFKPKAPITAFAHLISETNRIEALQNYIALCLIPEDRDDFTVLLDDIDINALNEIVNFLSEAYTTLPTE